MEFLRADDKQYVLPAGELYLSHFQEFVHDNILEYNLLNKLELVEQCSKKRQLFDFICDYLTGLSAYFEESQELNEIRSNMWHVDHFVKYLINEKRYDMAIKKMDDFIFTMLEYSNKMFDTKKR